MSEVESADNEERRRRAEARLAASRPLREAAAAAHAHDMADEGEGAVVRTSLAEIAADPRRFTEAERARLLAMTEEEIEAAALADPDNPPWTNEELAEARRERDERLAKAKRRAVCVDPRRDD